MSVGSLSTMYLEQRRTTSSPKTIHRTQEEEHLKTRWLCCHAQPGNRLTETVAQAGGLCREHMNSQGCAGEHAHMQRADRCYEVGSTTGRTRAEIWRNFCWKLVKKCREAQESIPNNNMAKTRVTLADGDTYSPSAWGQEGRRHGGAYGKRVVGYHFIWCGGGTIPLHEVENIRNVFLLQRCRARMGPQSVRGGEEKGFI